MNKPLILKERTGFQKARMRAYYYALYPFYRCTCELPREVLECNTPIIFCCNHYELFGPLAITLSLPLKSRLWVNRDILEPEEHLPLLLNGLQKSLPISAGEAYCLIHKLLPSLEYVWNQLAPVPIDREGGINMMRAMNQTAQLMQEGNHIIIFPETGENGYPEGGVGPFVQGFPMLGAFYKRLTGENAAFCPIYIDKQSRLLRFGNLLYWGEGDAASQSAFLSAALYQQMLSLSECNKTQPRLTLNY